MYLTMPRMRLAPVAVSMAGNESTRKTLSVKIELDEKIAKQITTLAAMISGG